MQQPYYAASGAGAPPVVQGTVVQGMPASVDDHHGGFAEVQKGEKQPKHCNDAIFAILYYAHLAVMAWVAATYAPQMTASMAEGYNGGGRFLESTSLITTLGNFVRSAFAGGSDRQLEEDNGESETSVGELMTVITITGFVGIVVSALSLSFLMAFAETLIKVALIFNIVASLLMGIAGAMSGAIPLALVGFLGCAFSAYYAYVVWARIPFAAANLKTAVAAVKKNFGLNFIAMASLFFVLGWTLWWSVGFVSATYVMNGCNANGVCETQANGFITFLFLISYFWTQQVIQNTVHVTVAGTVGTWWFAPEEAASCCSAGVRDSFVRSVTYSFGSICFGSLLVAIIQATKEIVRQMREQDDGILRCLAECLLGCLESLMEYFNKWAFVYVGLYGYSFIDAGKNVMTLFKTRGWTSIITDNLIDNVLGMIGVGVGLLTGLIGLLLASTMGLATEGMGGAFFVGFIVGLVLTSIIMGVVSSAVNTVIVCYAEAPNEFQQNHPMLSENMRATWRQAWPVEFGY